MAFFLSDDLTQNDKFEELDRIREAINQYGGDISPLKDPKDESTKITEEIKRVLDNCTAIWDKTIPDADVFQVMKRCSILIGLVLEFENGVDGNIDDCSALVHAFGVANEEGEKAGRGRVTTRVLYDMFQMNFPAASKAKYYIYRSWLNCCSKKNATYLLELHKLKIDKFIDKWEKDWEMSEGDIRMLRRSYQFALQRLERYEEAATAMEFLLQSYPDPGCDEAMSDASTCIVQALTTPSMFRFDHLRDLRAIQMHAETPIGQLLNIFICGTNNEYQAFTAEYNLTNLGFNEADIDTLDEKMKLLTLVALAEQKPDVLYKTVEDKLSLDEEECEDLAVKAFHLKLLRGRLDQGNERISTTYAITRDFAQADWLDLKNKLDLWQQNLEQVKESIKEVEQLAGC